MRVGVEVGGTFTDLVAIEDGRVRVAKVPSVPAHPDEGAMASLAAGEIDLATVEDLVHGSTVATNAILERKGAPVALLTTRGFRDVLFLQRHNRTQIYDLFYRKPVPVLARSDILEIDERMSAQGEVVEPLDEAATGVRLAEFLGSGKYKSVAICLLNGYAEPRHERQLAAMVEKKFPDLTVTCSADVTREFREYERTSTTTLAAYVQPVTDSYLRRFETQLGGQNFAGRFSIMQSNGGRLPVAGMSRNAITSLFSGPAAGVMGAVRQAGLSGYGELITLDMGGTSTDVCLVAGGKPNLSGETEVDGLPIRTPVLDIVTVGAGGGSICWQDDGGMLRVGPESAGADPGPACYGRGGKLPTATDADLVLGILDPENFLGGRMALDMGAAKRAIRTHVAKPLGLTVNRAAWGIRRVFETRMADLLRRVSIERGHDPREFTLFATGGAGPAHAYSLCAEVGLENFAIPATATAQSAYGTGTSDLRHAAERAVYGRLSSGGQANSDQVRSIAAALKDAEAEVRAALKMDRIPHGEDRVERSLGIRYLGQTNQLEVPAGLGKPTTKSIAAAIESFEEMYEALFGRGAGFRQAGFEISHARAVGTGVLDALPGTAKGEKLKPKGSRAVIFDNPERPVKTKVFAVTHPRASTRVQGPCIIEYPGHTAVLPPGSKARADKFGNLHVRVSK